MDDTRAPYSAAQYAARTSDAIRQTRAARARLGELVDAARAVLPYRGIPERVPQWTPLRPDAPVERAWLAVDMTGGRD